MIIDTERFQPYCLKILSAIDGNELSPLTETLEIVTTGKILKLNVTNKEYYVSATIPLDHEEPVSFHATVNAYLFLKLMAQITEKSIEILLADTYLNIKANGNYKIPLIFDNDKLMELPVINIDNPAVTMNIGSDVLMSMITYNSKELLKGTATKPVQKLYYVDQSGCITFTTGACVNSFILSQPVQLLLSDKVVQLFKLFKSDDVQFVLGHTVVSEKITQTRVRFSNADISITAILPCDDTLLNSVPVTAIRGRANNSYPCSVVMNRTELSQAISRLLLFSAGYGDKINIKAYGEFVFSSSSVTAWDVNKENQEVLQYQNGGSVLEEYTLTVDLTDLQSVLATCTEQYVMLNFGDHKALIISRGNIKNVIPEVVNLQR